MPSWNEIERYMVLSSDAHAGALVRDYRPYLEARWHLEFDNWAAAIKSSWFNPNDSSNWDSEQRLSAIDSEGITGEVLFPNTLPPFYDILAHLSGAPSLTDPISSADGPGYEHITDGWSTSVATQLIEGGG